MKTLGLMVLAGLAGYALAALAAEARLLQADREMRSIFQPNVVPLSPEERASLARVRERLIDSTYFSPDSAGA